MSILALSCQGTSIAVGLRINAQAKKRQPQKQKSNTATRKPQLGYDQLKKEAPAERAPDSDAPELRRANSGSHPQAPVTDGGPDGKDGDGKDAGETAGPLVADRGSVLRACVGTSAGLSLGAFLLRQIAHSGAEGEWAVPDLTVLMPFRAQLWHVIPTAGVVVLVTSCRQILQQVWPEFAQSSKVANNQVLRPLETVDVFTVSCLSGASEELLFRGALLPLLGADWKGVLGAGLIFGALHVTGGRNASFAVWASCVGVLYGILGLYTCDLAAPMAAHSMVNLLGAAIWKFSQNDEESKSL